VYELGEEHEALREAVRALAEKEIAPYAAEVDEQERYPAEAAEALTKAGFNAVHIPEEYDGQGADAVAACIVIEEVARVDASASLIPAVNKLGTQPIILSGSEEVKQLVLPTIASGEASASYALSEREAGSDTASMRSRASLEGDTWVLNGTKAWITNAGESTWYTVMAVTDPNASKKANGISAFVVHKDDPGFSVGPKERKLGIKGSPTREIYFENCEIPANRIIGEPGTGLKTALRTLEHTRHRTGCVGRGAGVREGPQAVWSARRRLPGRAVHAGGHGYEDRSRPPPRVRLGSGHRTRRQARRLHGLGGEDLRVRHRHGGHDRRRAAVRRRWVHKGLPGGTHDARRQDHPDL
jgi:alkylation response protein AidB-like acyl-CoA dehydrogenase